MPLRSGATRFRPMWAKCRARASRMDSFSRWASQSRCRRASRRRSPQSRPSWTRPRRTARCARRWTKAGSRTRWRLEALLVAAEEPQRRRGTEDALARHSDSRRIIIAVVIGIPRRPGTLGDWSHLLAARLLLLTALAVLFAAFLAPLRALFMPLIAPVPRLLPA